MTTNSSRTLYEQRRRANRRSNNSLRRTYDLLRSTVPTLEPGTPLIEQSLVDDLSASRNTVRMVLQALAAEGLVSRGRKVGTRVRASTLLPIDEVMPIADRGTRDMHAQLLECKVIVAPALIGNRLDLPEQSPLGVIETVVLEGNEPVALTTSYVGWRWDRRTLPGRGEPDIVSFLEEQLDVCIGECLTHVAAIACDTQTATLLGIDEGEPVLFLEDLLRDADGRPRAISQLRFRGYRVTMYAKSRRKGGGCGIESA